MWLSAKRAAVCSVTILLILSYYYASYFLPHSPLFSNSDEAAWKRRAIDRNEARLSEAKNYFSSLNPRESLFDSQRKLARRMDVLFVVITHDRNHRNTEYLTQVMAALHRQLSPDSSLISGLAICDTNDPGLQIPEVIFLEQFFPSVRTWNPEKNPKSGKTSYDSRNREKEDFVKCLENVHKDFQFSFLVVLEDDALLKPGFMDTLTYNLNYKLTKKFHNGDLIDLNQKIAFVKLYYPEKWKGFGLDFMSFVDLAAQSAVLAIILMKLTGFKRFLISFLSALIVQLLFGRQYFAKFREFHPVLSRLVEAPGCCTPAVLYPREILFPLINHLKLVQCSALYPLDVALDDFAHSKRLGRYLIQPNLVEHIGMYSTLTSPKEPWFF